MKDGFVLVWPNTGYYVAISNGEPIAVMDIDDAQHFKYYSEALTFKAGYEDYFNIKKVSEVYESETRNHLIA